MAWNMKRHELVALVECHKLGPSRRPGVAAELLKSLRLQIAWIDEDRKAGEQGRESSHRSWFPGSSRLRRTKQKGPNGQPRGSQPRKSQSFEDEFRMTKCVNLPASNGEMGEGVIKSRAGAPQPAVAGSAKTCWALATPPMAGPWMSARMRVPRPARAHVVLGSYADLSPPLLLPQPTGCS